METILIIVAGGSASGKTTVVKNLMSRLDINEVGIISLDNYYNDQSNLSMDERKQTNYDHPDSFDMDLLYIQLKELLAGKDIKEPVYDFVNHNRKENEYILISPKKVIILEGILALYDKKIRDLANLKIYVECDDDIRFIRRLERDMVERGRTGKFVIKQYLETVKPSHEAYVNPTKRYADIIIPNDKSHDVALEVILSRINDILRGNK